MAKNRTLWLMARSPITHFKTSFASSGQGFGVTATFSASRAVSPKSDQVF
jgi:hypothetical protein